jgi:hypothetical protein
MPRKARIDAAGALHHIIVRGIERRKIFWDNADRDSFVNRLGKVLIETHTDCFEWAMLPNHLHILMRIGLRIIHRDLLYHSHSGVAFSWTITSNMGSLCPVNSPIHLS